MAKSEDRMTSDEIKVFNCIEDRVCHSEAEVKVTESYRVVRVVWRDIQHDRCTKQTTAFTTRDQATIQDLTIRSTGKQTQTHT